MTFDEADAWALAHEARVEVVGGVLTVTAHSRSASVEIVGAGVDAWTDAFVDAVRELAAIVEEEAPPSSVRRAGPVRATTRKPRRG